MVGFGEGMTESRKLLEYLLEVGYDHRTIGQYQQPTRDYYPVIKYYHQGEFASLKEYALKNGISTC
jgi:lipoate synthase